MPDTCKGNYHVDPEFSGSEISGIRAWFYYWHCDTCGENWETGPWPSDYNPV